MVLTNRDKTPRYIRRLYRHCEKHGHGVSEYRIPLTSGETTMGVHLRAVCPNTTLIIVVHGLGADRYYPFTELFMTLLGSGYSLLSIDLDGHGIGNSHILEYPGILRTLPDIARWVSSTPAIAQSRTVLLGHSLGGAICLTQCDNRDFSGIIAVSAPHSLGRYGAGFGETLFVMSPSLWRQLRYYTPFELAPAFRKFKRDLFPCRTSGKNGSYLHDSADLLQRLRVVETCRRADIPLLLVHGRLDAIVPFAQAKTIHEAYISGARADCRFVSPRFATHMTTLFHPAVTSAILSWLSDIPVSGPSKKASSADLEPIRKKSTLPLFVVYPQLRQRLPFIALGQYPTPICRLDALAKRLGAGALYVKQDGLTGRPYGGNKVRKLEFLLGEARARGVREVMTFGCAGSNHAAATATYAHRLGMRSISMLLPQPNARYVEKNLLVSAAHHARLCYFPDMKSVTTGAWFQACLCKLRTGRFPYVIPAGGSSPRGIVGYINAAFELLEQIRGGALPVPKRIYLPMGTMGTAIGLLLGLRAAGLDSEVIPVRVTDTNFCNADKAMTLAKETIRFLRSADPSFPEIILSRGDIHICHDQYPPGYAARSDEAADAIALARDIEGMDLEGTYSGRAFAALVRDGKSGLFHDASILFWDTHNAHPVDIGSDALNRIPKAFSLYLGKTVSDLTPDTIEQTE
jgi:1-aminocyclopropane-1-carboxylate deaminase/D-cysteine desulfhydrase-like pyridoxal-dependent ACC family enzyme/pimeloyl-ACP methyl ester carboxylesterase